MQLERDAWIKLWNGYRRRAWRLEVRQTYSVAQEAEEFEQFTRTGVVPVDKDWQDSIRQRIDAGAYIGRVHLIQPPLTDYLRFELAAYRMTFDVGDDIRILDLSTTPNPGLPDEDFWILDDDVVRLLYREDGSLEGFDLVDAHDLPKYEKYMRAAVENSVPLDQYEP